MQYRLPASLSSNRLNLRLGKRADATYDELAKRLKEYGLDETRDLIASKLKRGSFPATFFLACCGALNLGSIQLKDI